MDVLRCPHPVPPTIGTTQVATPGTTPRPPPLPQVPGDPTTLKSRSPRPRGVPMPSPPNYQPANSASAAKPTTPTGNDSSGPSPAMSTSVTGPLSPGSNLGSNSFVFPIRSVFQGMAHSEFSTSISMASSSQGSTLNKVSSRGGGQSGRSPNRQEEKRRFSVVSPPGQDEEVDDDAGMTTIAQVLQQGSDQAKAGQGSSSGSGIATLTGKTDHNVSGSRPRVQAPPLSAAGNVETAEQPQGFFSMPIMEKESSQNPFFSDARRASEGQYAPSRAPDRPVISTEDSGHTVVTRAEVVNDSTEGEGSGLPQKDRAPVGVPQEKPSGVNYRDYPTPDGPSAEKSTFTTGPSRELRAESRTSLVPEPEAVMRSAPQQPDIREPQPDIKEPQPRFVSAGGMAGLTSPTQRKSISQNTNSPTSLEVDKSGERTLESDFSGIVRLAEAGSYGSATGVPESAMAKGSQGSKGSAGAASGPTGLPLAHRQRQMAKTASNTRDSVSNFMNDQATMVNLSDPNAPALSPGPNVAEQEKHLESSKLGQGVISRDREGGGDAPGWGNTSESSLSVQDCSEVATASGGEQDSGQSSDESPIVTFRFEHTQTGDGHHVVVGREGKLQRCEDEPITTPGAVQGFGVLLVLEEVYDSGMLIVRQVSENATELLGLSPKYLFRLDCFTRILTTEQEDILRDNIEYLPDTESGKGSVEEEGPQVFLLSGYGEPGSADTEEDDTDSDVASRRREWTCWVTAHRPKQKPWEKTHDRGRPVRAPDLIILEFELERDPYNPLMQNFEPVVFANGQDTPDSGSQTTQSAGSTALRSGSTGSQGNTSESVATVGSAPRPGPGGQIGSDSSIAVTERPDSEYRGSRQDAKSSSKRRPSIDHQGLQGLDMEIPLEKILESTTNHARPLRALERMRRTARNGEDSASGSGSRGGRRGRPAGLRQPAGSTDALDVFAVLGQINDQLGAAPDLETFLKIAVGVVQDLSRFHRVLLYQFDENFNGQVVAELVEWGKTTDLFKGLMFPAADIPAQARELYKVNKVRLLYDRSQTTARLVLRSKEDLDHPLDMTHCYLRSMSPIHIKYLANMGVRSSMSVSIMAFGQLWGLIACHGYGHSGMRVSFPVRQMMRILSDSISRNIERLSYAQRLHTRKLVSTLPTTHHPTGYIVSNADDLLTIFDADSGLLVIGDGCKLLGNNEQGQAMLAIAEYLRIRKFDNMKASNHLSSDCPDLVLPRVVDTIAGLLYVPITAKAGQDFIVFLRKGQAREVQWAGKPYKDEKTGDMASLEPRKSFKVWNETVIGRSRAWTDDQMESAGTLALICGKFIQVWREKQSAMASNQLTAILLSNTSHAVRTPLSQIINTLELALAGDIDPDTRAMLENTHQASRALLFHVHDLLDLTRIETGNETAFNDPFDLRQSIHDAIRLYQTETARRGLDFRVNVDPNLPQFVVGDSRKIKTVISNLVANSVKFTEKGRIEVYCGLQRSDTTQDVVRAGYIHIEIVISDTGCGVPTDKLEAMFVILEGADENKSESTGLGLGLAVVARIVEQLAGQLRAESVVGVGTRFFFTLQMLVGDEARSTSRASTKSVVRQPRTGSTDDGSEVSAPSGSTDSQRSHFSEIDSFVQDFGASHILSGPTVPADDKRIREAGERMDRPGTYPVTDLSWPIRPGRLDNGENDQTAAAATPAAIASPQLPSSSPSPNRPSPSTHRHLSYRPAAWMIGSPTQSPVAMREKRGPKGEQTLRVLVVEDDAINSQILQKRLRMDQHAVSAVNNGQEAVDTLRKDWDIDCVLMDIQRVDRISTWVSLLMEMDRMPIMDGRRAANEIRRLESTLAAPREIDPLRIDGRIPIFAVSASLYESDLSNLAQDFDGWLLKPLDFSRVRRLLLGLEDVEKRSAEVYVQGHWEKGGYLRDAPRTPLPSPSEVKDSSFF